MEYLWGAIPVIGGLIFAGAVGHELGKKQGYKTGHRDGWNTRHTQSTDEENAAWLERAKAHQLELMAATGLLDGLKPTNSTDVRDS